MCDCKNCYWYGKCQDVEDEVVECDFFMYYDLNQITETEYDADLQMRAEVYKEFVREMQN